MNHQLSELLRDIVNKQIDKKQLIYFLNHYYQFVIYKIDEKSDNQIFEEGDNPFPEELTLPLDKRKSGILEALNIVLRINPNVNEDDGSCNALMITVGNADAFLTEYLLEKGAILEYGQIQKRYKKIIILKILIFIV